MSKLADRVPALATREDKLAVAENTLADIAGPGGRINQTNLVDAIEKQIEGLAVVEDRLIAEGRRAAAQQIASAWANSRTIKIDRSQRVPVYQPTLGFEASYFKVGSEYVPTETMTADDFLVMLERADRRMAGAQTDRDVIQEFFDRARPGLESGENLVQQFQSGKLALAAASGHGELEEAEEDEES